MDKVHDHVHCGGKDDDGCGCGDEGMSESTFFDFCGGLAVTPCFSIGRLLVKSYK